MTKNVFEELCDEIDKDFSILNKDARNRLKSMIKRMAEDAYFRGLNAKKGE